ncbi:MAG: tRNA (adenosine(37)-N6)-threonylcarbamoyltransferase complex dimerization subunit type 1 TsaB [Bdellovibrio sp.]|nr:tRNA (adenosine(37)-N6)-threonylcarbamoyltransferase complex dimerization subunit type 1 TsaB [Bdellovibrio sp.]
MKFIAWDTSSKTAALATFEADTKTKNFLLIQEQNLDVTLTTHSEKLLFGINQILKNSNLNIQDIDCFGVGLGPGSFTGLRVGITTARTLANALNKPLIGISSLAALARGAIMELSTINLPDLLIATTDACKGELFALYGKPKDILNCVIPNQETHHKLWHKDVCEKVLSPQKLIHKIEKKKKQNWLAIGEGRNRYLEHWVVLSASEMALETAQKTTLNQIRGKYLAQLVWAAYQAGFIKKALQVFPRYLRASSAELKLKRLSDTA